MSCQHLSFLTKADMAEWLEAETQRRAYVQRAAREVGKYIATTRAECSAAALEAVTVEQAVELATDAASRPQAVRDMLFRIWSTTGKAYVERTRRSIRPRKFDDWINIVDFWEDIVRGYLQNEFVRKVTGIDQTTQQAIRTYLQSAIEEGMSVQNVAKLIAEGTIPNMNRARALRIARTEVIGASNAGSLAGARSMQIKGLKKKWLVALDGRERPEHAAVSASTAVDPIDIDDLFNVGGDMLEYPGDPRGSADMVINCRCAVGYVTPLFG